MKVSESKVQNLLEANRILSSMLRLPEPPCRILELAAGVVEAETFSLPLCGESTRELSSRPALTDKEFPLQQLRLTSGDSAGPGLSPVKVAAGAPGGSVRRESAFSAGSTFLIRRPLRSGGNA